MTSVVNAIPAHRLPPELQPPPRNALTPIDATALRQQPPAAYLIGPHDVLGVFIQDITTSAVDRKGPQVAELPVTTQGGYYPPLGMINSPA